MRADGRIKLRELENVSLFRDFQINFNLSVYKHEKLFTGRVMKWKTLWFAGLSSSLFVLLKIGIFQGESGQIGQPFIKGIPC